MPKTRKQSNPTAGGWVERPRIADEEVTYYCPILMLDWRGPTLGYAYVQEDFEGWNWGVVLMEEQEDPRLRMVRSNTFKPRLVSEGTAPTKEEAMKAAMEAAESLV